MVLSGDQSTRVTIKTMHQNYLEPPYGLVWIVYSSLPYSPIIYFSKCTKPNRSKYHKALSFGEHQDSSNNDTEWLRPYRKLRLIEENSIKWCSFKCRQEFIRDVSWLRVNMTHAAWRKSLFSKQSTFQVKLIVKMLILERDQVPFTIFTFLGALWHK